MKYVHGVKHVGQFSFRSKFCQEARAVLRGLAQEFCEIDGCVAPRRKESMSLVDWGRYIGDIIVNPAADLSLC